jgi:hypothetical protein
VRTLALTLPLAPLPPLRFLQLAAVGKTTGSPTLDDEKYETKHVN